MNASTKRTFIGVALVVIAVAIILSALNVSFFPNIFGGLGFWPIFWTVVLVIVLVESIVKQNWIMVFLAVAFLVMIYNGRFGLPVMPLGAVFGAAVTLGLGLEILLPRGNKKPFVIRIGDKIRNNESGNVRVYKDGEEIVVNEDGEPVSYEISENHIENNVGSLVHYFKMKDFKAVNLENNCGSLKAYFVDAEMAENTAVINAENNLGSTEIFIPSSWNCELRKEIALGSISETGRASGDGEHTVIINAECNLGQIIVHHV